MSGSDLGRCVLCDGPIYPGEPFVMTEVGIAHRFSTTCNWHKEELLRDSLVDFDDDKM